MDVQFSIAVLRNAPAMSEEPSIGTSEAEGLFQIAALFIVLLDQTVEQLT